MPTCQRNMRVQKGSSAAGPFGKLARFVFIAAKKACDKPVPFVNGMPDGRDEGRSQPAIASPRMVKSSSNSTPSEISKAMRVVARVGVGAVTRVPAKEVRDTGGRGIVGRLVGEDGMVVGGVV